MVFLVLNSFTHNIFRLNRLYTGFFRAEAYSFHVNFMSASLHVAGDWNFRAFDKRLITVKTKNETLRKAAVLDALTNLTFAIEIPDIISMDELGVDRQVLANIRVYTAKNMEGINADFIDFFQALDVDQSVDDFIKAYWIYPSKIRFELIDLEEP